MEINRPHPCGVAVQVVDERRSASVPYPNSLVPGGGGQKRPRGGKAAPQNPAEVLCERSDMTARFRVPQGGGVVG